MAFRLIADPNGAADDGTFEQKLGNFSMPFLASAAVTAKRVVALATTGKVATAATDATASTCIGIAPKAAIAANDTIPVVLMGPVDNVSCHGTVNAGTLLKRSTSTAGWVEATAAPAEGEVVGFAITASASDVCDVWVGHGGGCGVS